MVLPSNELCPEGSHIIKISNLKNNEIVNYSLLFIKGHILSTSSKTYKCQKQITIINQDTQSKSWDVVNSEFKIFLLLNKGINHFQLIYCSEKIDLRVFYHVNNTDFCVTPLYIICKNHDGQFQAPGGIDNSIDSACKRIDLGIRLIQTLTSEKIYEIFFKRKTFQIEWEINENSERCIIFKSDLNVEEALKMSQESLWDHFANEIMHSPLASSKRKYLAFLSCTFYEPMKEDLMNKIQTHQEILKRTRAHAALGGGGLALFGSACLHTWPQNVEEIISKFLDQTLVDTSSLMNDSCYRNTYGGCFATTLGAVCHELGHTFDLGHTKSGIMGRGFDHIDKVFTLSNLKKSFNTNAQFVTVDLAKNLTMTYSISDDPNSNTSKNQNNTKSQQANISNQKHSKLKINSNDNTFWTSSCANILFYHKWLNDITPEKESKLHFNLERNAIESSSGIQVIELRGENGMVLNSWEFVEGKGPLHFEVPSEKINKSHSILIEDLNGTIFKHTF